MRLPSRSSAASSIVITRSPASMKDESAFSSVVLPEPVPPLTSRLRRAATAVRSSSRSSASKVPRATSSSGSGPDAREAADRHRRAVDRQRRDHDVHPRAVGEPAVGHRAELVDPAPDRSEDALDRRRGAPRSRVKPTSARSSRPRRSTQTSSWPLTSTSSTSGSRSNSSSGPSPTVSRRTRSATRSRDRPRRGTPPGRRPAPRPPRGAPADHSAPATASARRSSISWSRSSAASGRCGRGEPASSTPGSA